MVSGNYEMPSVSCQGFRKCSREKKSIKVTRNINAVSFHVEYYHLYLYLKSTRRNGTHTFMLNSPTKAAIME